LFYTIQALELLIFEKIYITYEIYITFTGTLKKDISSIGHFLDRHFIGEEI